MIGRSRPAWRAQQRVPSLSSSELNCVDRQRLHCRASRFEPLSRQEDGRAARRFPSFPLNDRSACVAARLQTRTLYNLCRHVCICMPTRHSLRGKAQLGHANSKRDLGFGELPESTTRAAPLATRVPSNSFATASSGVDNLNGLRPTINLPAASRAASRKRPSSSDVPGKARQVKKKKKVRRTTIGVLLELDSATSPSWIHLKS